MYNVTKLVAAFLLLSLCCCSRKIDDPALVGRYILITGPGADVLELKADMTYVHSYKDSGATPETSGTGQWELEKLEEGKTVVTLHDFQPLPGEQTRGRGFYLLKVQSSMGKLQLVTDVDLNYYYEKQK